MEKLSKENQILKELLQEDPDLLYFTELGIILSDYMTAYVRMNENEMRGSAKTTNFSLCLVMTISKRYDKNSQFIQ